MSVKIGDIIQGTEVVGEVLIEFTINKKREGVGFYIMQDIFDSKPHIIYKFLDDAVRVIKEKLEVALGISEWV